LLHGVQLGLIASVFVAGNTHFLRRLSALAQPWETFCLIALWSWCGWRWLREDKVSAAVPAPGAPGGPEPAVRKAVAAAPAAPS
jgi:hypothetical protein